MRSGTRWLVGLALAAALGLVAVLVRRTEDPPDAAPARPPRSPASPRPPRVRARAGTGGDIAAPAVAETTAAPSPPAGPAASADRTAEGLRAALAAFEPPPAGKWVSGDPFRAVAAAARATQRSPERQAEMWALVESETDPAVLRGLVALTQRRPLSPATPADRDRAWDLALREAPPDRRRAAVTLWLLGEAWTPSSDRTDRVVRALDGALPFDVLGPVVALVGEEALARDPLVRDALGRAIERAPAEADAAGLPPLLADPWLRHDPYRQSVAAWRAADSAERRESLAAEYADRLAGTTVGGFADGPPRRGRPVEAPVVRGTVEIYAATSARDVRIRIAAGLYRSLGLDDAGRKAVYDELAHVEPDPELRERLWRLATDPAAVARETEGRLDVFLRAAGGAGGR